jgi:hypothetical protein
MINLVDQSMKNAEAALPDFREIPVLKDDAAIERLFDEL